VVADAGYNDIRIPGNSGADISFTDDLATDPAAFERFRCSYRMNDRHNLSLLVAPLRLRAKGSVDHPLVWPEVTSARGSATGG
jgi:hypothetical protein